MTPTESNDPLGYVDELREVLGSPYMQLVFHGTPDARAAVLESLTAQLGSAVSKSSLSVFGDAACELNARWKMASQVAEKVPELRENAITVVASLGFCRLYGITIPSDIKRVLGTPLPPESLVSSIIETLSMLHAATEDARALPERFDEAEPLEDRSLCTSLLHHLMELWAVFVVVDDEYQKHICDVEQRSDSHFGIWMRRLLDASAALDDELQRDEQIRLLSVATELPLLENWRKMLVEPFCDPLPWWLDGTLEEAAGATRRQIAKGDVFVQVPAKQHRASALGILQRRNEEIAREQATLAVAASAGEKKEPAADDLVDARWLVAEDPTIRVRLELKPSEVDQRQLVVALVGAMEDIQKYMSAELNFRTGTQKRAELPLGWGIVELQKEQVDDLASLLLVDSTGNRRMVKLEQEESDG